ncbi:hypothetical protein ABW20_dc0102657 [Dactylellina cionopaga]|nr:hypothetical protein ABW20_dc0102657 [Dactylellina cionopaga]
MTLLSTSTIRVSEADETARYLQKLLAESSDENVTRQLIQAVEQSSLPPSIYAIWLSVSHAPITIHQALKQNVSNHIRKLALHRLQRLLATTQWKGIWDGLGGTQGLLDLFSDLSVSEVRDACHAIGQSSKKSDSDEKRHTFSDFVKALFGRRLFPEATYQSPDERSLAKYYQYLVPGCTGDLVTTMLSQTPRIKWNTVQKRLLLECHAETLRNLTLDFGDDSNNPVWEAEVHTEIWENQWLEGLVQRYPSAFKGLHQQPSVDEYGVGFSPSMQFSIDCLKKFSTEPKFRVDIDIFSREVVSPLLKRALKKKVDWLKIKEILDLAQSCLASYKDEYYSDQTLIELVAQCWSNKPDIFEEQFRYFLRSNSNLSRDSKYWFGSIIYTVDRPLRYKLLKVCFKEIVDIDLDEKPEENFKLIKSSLSSSILSNLEPVDALDLLTRSRKAKGDTSLIKEPFNLWHVLLLRDTKQQEKAEEIALNCLGPRKKSASSNSDPKERAFYAKSSLYYAIASGSLTIYKETLDWARRFMRDRSAIPEIYKSYPKEAQKLLSGIPEFIDVNQDRTHFRNRVEEANKIIEELFDTVYLALREPSFEVSEWEGTLCLFQGVVQERIRRSPKLQKSLNLSDNEVYDILWESLVKLILTVEGKALESGFEKMNLNNVRGVLGYKNPSEHPAVDTLPEYFPRGLPIQHLIAPFYLNTPSLKICAPYIESRANSAVFLSHDAALAPIPMDEDSMAAIGNFIDDYIVALKILVPETLEEEERQQVADCAWAHAVGPLSHGRLSAEEAVSYWRNRFGQAVGESWAPKTSTEPDDWAIIPNTNDPTEAVEWNPTCPQGADIRPRYLGNLTYIDLSTAVSGFVSHQPKQSVDSNRGSRRTRGRGRGRGGRGRSVRESAPESTTRKETGEITIHSELRPFVPLVRGQKFKEIGIWHPTRTERARNQRSTREGQILSALLYLDTKISGKISLLSASFPSTDDVRYPSAYLDGDFLLKGNPQTNAALRVLNAHIKDVPPVLLAKLTESALSQVEPGNSDGKKPDSGESADPKVLAFKLLELLWKCDKPALASTLAVKTIIQHPDASSWHRQLLSSGSLRILSASDSRACFKLFADSIIAKIEEWGSPRETVRPKANDVDVEDLWDSQAVDSWDTPKGENKNDGDVEGLWESQEVDSWDKPEDENMNDGDQLTTIKLTTVKYLAQLLNDTESVPEDFCLSTLSTLSEKASHIDVRKAVVESVLSKLVNSGPEFSDKIFTVLETFIPIAGNFNERSPISETDWEKALETSELPKIDLQISTNNAPILNLLFKFASDKLNSQDSPHRNPFQARLILPIIESLKTQTSKYISIFLQKHGVDEKDLRIAPVPKSFFIWNQMISSFGISNVPRSTVEEFIDYIIFNTALPTTIKALNNKFKKDPGLSDQPEVKYWIQLYGCGTGALSFKGFHFSNIVHYGDDDDDDTKFEWGLNLILRLFDALLWNSDMFSTAIKELWEELENTKYDENWHKIRRPIVETMVNRVDAIRTPEWEQDPNRQPKFLPDVFPLRLLLLKYPTVGNENREADCKDFAEGLIELINQTDGCFYDRKLSQLKDAMGWIDRDDRVFVASHLGKITETRPPSLTMQDQLRLQLSAFSMHLFKSQNKNAIEAVETLLKSWITSENEEIRRLGYLTRSRYGGLQKIMRKVGLAN